MSRKVVDELSRLIRKVKTGQEVLTESLEKLLRQPPIAATVLPEMRSQTDLRERAYQAVVKANDALTDYRRAVEKQRDLYETGR